MAKYILKRALYLLLVLSVIFMVSMHPMLTLIAMIPAPIIILYSIRFHFKVHKSFEECDENEGKLSAMAQENLTGVRVVRAFGREKYEIERHPSGMYGVHIEYDYCYLRPEDCIDISTDKDSFYCYPEKQNVVTKLSLATEEIFKLHMEKVNREKVKK